MPDSKCKLAPATAQVLRDRHARTIVATTDAASATSIARVRSAGGEVVRVHATADGNVELRALFECDTVVAQATYIDTAREESERQLDELLSMVETLADDEVASLQAGLLDDGSDGPQR